MKITQTERLILRDLNTGDAPFFYGLVNEPAWIANIGDRRVRSIEDAEKYINENIVASYVNYGFGMYLLELSADGTPLGICGLVKRDSLPHPDLGFALLEQHWGQGYAEEAAVAILELAFDQLHLERVLAITTPANEHSQRLLMKLGFCKSQPLNLNGEELQLYLLDAAHAGGCVNGIR